MLHKNRIKKKFSISNEKVKHKQKKTVENINSIKKLYFDISNF